MNLKNSKAIFIENSSLPRLLSFFAPININAITLGPFVFASNEVSEITRNHENIHWQQYIELGILGFPFMYMLYYVIGLFKYQNSKIAYYSIPFEQEAYSNHEDLEYLKSRKRYYWLKYKV